MNPASGRLIANHATPRSKKGKKLGMFLSHRSFVRPSLGSTRLSLRAAVRVRPCLARQCRPSVRDSVCPSASLFIPFNHCVMPFACRPSLHASLSLSFSSSSLALALPSETEPTESPSVRPSHPSPLDRPSDWEKHLKQLARLPPTRRHNPWERGREN